ncbi:putative serine/threonine-protein kinase pix13 [Castilleja foliolosa]|uniref:non-specific serine/threonine protein kinase n=1 Tax=Castilleja foliolosa TaxID=1961234 RepID=A0ABD3BQM6_9LAMI
MGNCWPTPVDSQPTGPLNPDLKNKSEVEKVNNKSRSNSSKGSAAEIDGGSEVPKNLKVFTLAELKRATRNFRPDTVLGEGGFGRVFKGYVDDKTLAPSKVGVGMPVAVKKSDPDSEQGLKEWQAEVQFLGKFSHPNLVKLLGYCWEERQFLLVYEYVQKGSLESHLFRTNGGGETIPWEIRMKIAIGAARGLAFLHNTEKHVIYRDFKASNILLDADFNPKLADFGLAKSGPDDGNSHVTTKVVGTYGYAAPEYMATGHLYVKSDVYGFGVVLLEILMGLKVMDLNRPSAQANLVDWAKPSLPDQRKLRKLMDPRLEGEYPMKAAFGIAQLILTCLEPDPKNRPDMEEVLATLEDISAIQMKAHERKAQMKQQHQHQSPYHTYNGADDREHQNLKPAARTY